MLVPEQLLDLAQARARAQQFRGEHVPERVWRDPLPLGDAGRQRVAAEGLAEDGGREASTILQADEEGRLGVAGGKRR